MRSTGVFRRLRLRFWIGTGFDYIAIRANAEPAIGAFPSKPLVRQEIAMHSDKRFGQTHRSFYDYMQRASGLALLCMTSGILAIPMQRCSSLSDGNDVHPAAHGD